MTNAWRKKAISAAAIAACLCVSAGSAWAGAFVHGAICQASGSQAGYSVNLIGVDATSSLSVFCPSPIDHDVGASLQWQTRVTDGTSTGEVRCLGAATDSAGNQIGTTATVGSGVAFTGGTDILYSFTAPVGSPSYSYVTQCLMPSPGSAGSSTVKTIRVF